MITTPWDHLPTKRSSRHVTSRHSPVPASDKIYADWDLGSCLWQGSRSKGRRRGSGGRTRRQGPRDDRRTHWGPPGGRTGPRSCTSWRRRSSRCPPASFRARTGILSRRTPPRLLHTRRSSTWKKRRPWGQAQLWVFALFHFILGRTEQGFTSKERQTHRFAPVVNVFASGIKSHTCRGPQKTFPRPCPSSVREERVRQPTRSPDHTQPQRS